MLYVTYPLLSYVTLTVSELCTLGYICYIFLTTALCTQNYNICYLLTTELYIVAHTLFKQHDSLCIINNIHNSVSILFIKVLRQNKRACTYTKIHHLKVRYLCHRYVLIRGNYQLKTVHWLQYP